MNAMFLLDEYPDLESSGGFCILQELENNNVEILKIVYANSIYINEPRVKDYLDQHPEIVTIAKDAEGGGYEHVLQSIDNLCILKGE